MTKRLCFGVLSALVLAASGCGMASDETAAGDVGGDDYSSGDVPSEENGSNPTAGTPTAVAADDNRNYDFFKHYIAGTSGVGGEPLLTAGERDQSHALFSTKQGPKSSLDVALRKHFHVFGRRMTASLEITNLLNRENHNLINPVTGEAYAEGDDIVTGGYVFDLPPHGYRLPVWDNPTRFGPPRHIKLGLEVAL